MKKYATSGHSCMHWCRSLSWECMDLSHANCLLVDVTGNQLVDANTYNTFQPLMDQVLAGEDSSFVYLDDILISSRDEEQHKIHMKRYSDDSTRRTLPPFWREVPLRHT